jgi:hypothetical protein
MKAAELVSEMALATKSALKDRRLRAVLTPENIAANYEKVIAALGYKLSIDDINDLAADINDTAMSDDDVKFNLDLMLRKLPAKTKPVISFKPDEDETRVRGFIPDISFQSQSYPARQVPATYFIEYGRGKWKVSFYHLKAYNSAEHKSFEPEQAVEALTWTLNKLKKLMK